MRSRPTSALLAAALAVGCAGRAATIRRSDGSAFRATIEHSDASALYLRGPNGNQIPLGQLEVSEIDHPGNELAIVGMGFITAGLLFLVPAIVNDGAKNGAIAALALVGVAGVGVGVPMVIHNGIRWQGSRARAAAFEAARPSALPPAVPAPPPAPVAPASPAAAE